MTTTNIKISDLIRGKRESRANFTCTHNGRLVVGKLWISEVDVDAGIDTGATLSADSTVEIIAALVDAIAPLYAMAEANRTGDGEAYAKAYDAARATGLIDADGFDAVPVTCAACGGLSLGACPVCGGL